MENKKLNGIIANYKKGLRLKLLRNLMKLRQNELAEFLGIERAEYCKTENGFSKIREERLSKVEEIFRLWRTDEIQRLKGRINFLNAVFNKDSTDEDLIKRPEYKDCIDDAASIKYTLQSKGN